MQSVKAKKGARPKVSVRDLGSGAKKGLDKKALKKVRGGESGTEAMAVGDSAAARKPKPRPCTVAGERCDRLKYHLEGVRTLLTVQIPSSS